MLKFIQILTKFDHNLITKMKVFAIKIPWFVYWNETVTGYLEIYFLEVSGSDYYMYRELGVFFFGRFKKTCVNNSNNKEQQI